MNLDENIFITEYNPLWSLLFNKEAAHIKTALDFYNVHIEHIGSTSVTGLYAKPIVDMQIGIDCWDYLDKIRDIIILSGYEYFGEAGVVGRHYFRKRGADAFNVHVVLWNDVIWVNNILIRDYLKNNKDVAHQYGLLKKGAMEKGINTLLAYSDHKAYFIQRLLEAAKSWKDNE
jgi:GrpB-like predicted nucleotidyltransferase (UPF0157 family)